MIESEREYIEQFCFTPTVLEKQVGICTLRLGRNTAKPNYAVGPRYLLDGYSLHFVLEGRGKYQLNNKCYELKAGDAFCLFPKMMHSYKTDPDHVLRMFWIGLNGRQVLPLLKRVGIGADSPYRSDVVNDMVVELMDEMLEKSQDPFVLHDDLFKVSSLLRLFQIMADSSHVVLDGRAGDSSSWVRKGREYMDRHYAEGITVNKVAGFAGVDRTHFSKKFYESYGIRPMKYLQTLIMRDAANLTKDPDMKLSQIASSLGFTDIYTFSRAFKQYYGVSPNQYRSKALVGGD